MEERLHVALDHAFTHGLESPPLLRLISLIYLSHQLITLSIITPICSHSFRNVLYHAL